MFFFVLFFVLYLFMGFWFFCVGGGVTWLVDFFILSLGGFDVSLGFLFDYVSVGFFCRVSFISGLVFFYSFFYIRGTVDFRRFVWLVFGFVFSMFVLVFSRRFFMTMVG